MILYFLIGGILSSFYLRSDVLGEFWRIFSSDWHSKQRTPESFEIAQNTKSEVEGRQYTADKEIQLLLGIDPFRYLTI